MEKIKYRDLIMQYLTALEPDQTITTEQVAEYVAERLLLDTAMVKKTVNVNMARLEKEGQIMRLTKGIYCRRVKTAFGYYTPDKETLFCKQLLRKEPLRCRLMPLSSSHASTWGWSMLPIWARTTGQSSSAASTTARAEGMPPPAREISPVMIKVPVKRSANPRYTFPLFIAMSEAITADSGGVIFMIPIADDP